MKMILSIALTAFILNGCGESADQYQSLIDEYKNVMCIGMDPNVPMSEKTVALNRQVELNEEYKQVLLKLSAKEQQNLTMRWAKAVAEVSEGKCP